MQGVGNLNINGATVYAADTGYVIHAVGHHPNVRRDALGHGNMIIIRHPTTGYYTVYSHLQPGLYVTVGQHVLRGTPIGRVGTSGWSTGFHLHFEIGRGFNSNTNNLTAREDPINYFNDRSP